MPPGTTGFGVVEGVELKHHPPLIGWLLLVVIGVWWLVRCIRGLRSLGRGQPPANLTTWGF